MQFLLLALPDLQPEAERRREVRRLRWPHRVYALVFGYFWLECPACGKGFGGHEWKDRRGKLSSIPCGSCTDSGHRIGICPECTLDGVGYER
jgi:hypothetical protein